MILFFDTETTGLCPGRIIQLSYIMQTANEVKAKNFFFYADYVEPGAVAVHGFTPEKLLTLSGGKTFSCDMDEIYDDFISADLIAAHNLNFDLKFMMAEFAYHDRRFRYKEGFCTMRNFTSVTRLPGGGGRYKYPKLTELTDFLEIYPYDINRVSAELFGAYAASHDARYDTAALYLAFNTVADTDPDTFSVREKYLSEKSGESGEQ